MNLEGICKNVGLTSKDRRPRDVGEGRTGLFGVVRKTAIGRLLLKYDGTSAENTFRLSAKRTSPFKSASASFQSTTGSSCAHQP